MASKTVWIAGGIVVAIGVVAYVAFKPGPANTDTSGTIVEAKRARADGTNSVNPTPTASTTDQSSDASKSTPGADAGKDAARAAGESGDNKTKRALEAADASLAAGEGSSELKAKMAVEHSVRQAADADLAAGGPKSTNLARTRPASEAPRNTSNASVESK